MYIWIIFEHFIAFVISALLYEERYKYIKLILNKQSKTRIESRFSNSLCKCSIGFPLHFTPWYSDSYLKQTTSSINSVNKAANIAILLYTCQKVSVTVYLDMCPLELSWNVHGALTVFDDTVLGPTEKITLFPARKIL